ncbi:MAG: AMP-binding protein, partial [Planctomycetota bacterium]
MSGTESLLAESRRFEPPADFAKDAHIGSIEQYEQLHRRSLEDPDGFWAEEASKHHWFEPWTKVLEYDAPDAKWFVGGKTNIAYNCLDRQIDNGLGDQTAIVWEAEGMDADGKPVVEHWSHAELHREVCKFANVLKARGVKKGDVVTIYMGMVPQLAIAMLACARIGAPHSIIFGGFSASAIRDRVEDGESRIIVTCDGSYRRAKVVPLKDNVDEALTMTDRVDTVIVYERTKHDGVNWVDGRDHKWDALIADASEDCEAEQLDSEDLAFILYTSGSTGKPKGIMHTTGGYMVYTAMTARLTFDLKPELAKQGKELYWCTADIGWITGHSYIIYGLLPNAVPTLMYEGGPNFPD